MTNEERQWLRHAVSQARLARVQIGNQECERCGSRFEVDRPCNAKKRFCSNSCRNSSNRALHRAAA